MSANIAKKEPLSNSMKIKIAITALVPCLIMLYPSNEVLTGSVKLFFALTVCAILMFAFEIMGNFAPALLLPVAYIISVSYTHLDVYKRQPLSSGSVGFLAQ